MRLHVDLRGYGAFSNTVLTHDQNRAFAFGNTGDRALNLPLNRGKLSFGDERFRLPLRALDGCKVGHEES
jgi:hypothetical protein